jgi:hypothetical protein
MSHFPTIKPRIDFMPKADSILGEATHRGMRIVHTNDPRLVGQKDLAGFSITQGFIVLDEFDEPVLPPAMSWFYTPYDAISAIEMREVAMPEIKANQPATSFQYEYTKMWQYRQNFDLVYLALNNIQAACDEGDSFGEDPCEKVKQILHTLRQSVGQQRPQQ